MKFNIIDNTGVLLVKAFTNNTSIFPGKILKGIIITVKPTSIFKRKTFSKILIVKNKKPYTLLDNSTYKFYTNDAILLDKHNNPLGTRIHDIISYKCINTILCKSRSLLYKYI